MKAGFIMTTRAKALAKIIGALLTAILSMTILYEVIFANSLTENYGLAGVFFAALFSHLAIIARGFFIPLFLSLTKLYNPLILGLVAGLGGALGELTVYYWGLGIKETLSSDEKDNHLPKWVERYGLLVALLFAASPLPDTPIMLLAGSLRFPLSKIVFIQVIGKTTLYSLGAVVGGFVLIGLTSMTDEMSASAIIFVASIILCIALSWRKSREKILQVLERIMRRLHIRIDVRN